MARLSGVSTESFSSARDRLSTATVGLGSILRDQKILSGTSPTNLLLGLASHSSPARPLSKSPARSLASSPIEPSGLLEADDSDEFKEEDIWAADIRSSSEMRSSLFVTEKIGLGHEFGLPHGHSHDHGHDQGFGHSYRPESGFTYVHKFGHSHSHAYGHSNGLSDAAKQRLNVLDGMRASRRQVEKGFGLSDAFTTAGSVGLSPLSRMSESQAQPAPPLRHPTSSWMIPQVENSLDDPRQRHVEYQSAPVNVPDWSKILKGEASAKGKSNEIIHNGEDDEDEERMPPHELLAKEYARSQMMTFSVCEGQGRTLKGRDMSRVRNAVWRQTGFAD